jgi:hypothetical protein
MKSKKFLLVAAVVLAVVLGSVGIAYAITNGQPDGDAHPYVGLLVFDFGGGPAWRCSGALLSPTVVLTAGHCTDGAEAARVWFDEEVSAVWDDPPGEYPFGGATSYEGISYTMPGFCLGCAGGLPGFDYHDVGVVVLTEPVPADVVGEYAQLPGAGLVDTLKNKTDVDLVGYGVQWQEGVAMPPRPRWTGLRMRFFAPTQLVSGKFVHSDEFIKLTANPAQGKGGSCFGDSGGPDLLGDTDTVLAVNSYVTNANCKGVTYSNRVDVADILEWINGFLD